MLVLMLAVLLPASALRAENNEDNKASMPGLRLGAPDLNQALARDDPARIELAVVMAVAENPGRVEAIVGDAVGQAPRYRNEIIAAATEAYPGFADRIAAAAGTARPAGASGAASGAAPATAQAGPAPAQQTASASARKKPAKWSGEIELGGSRTTGNTETEQVNAAIGVTYKSRPWVTNLKATYDFASDSNTINTQRLRAGADTEYGITERFFAFGLADYIDDRFSGFEYELTQAAGVGYKLIKSEDVTFKVSAGPGLRISKREDTGETAFEPVARGNANLLWKISDSAKFTNDAVVTWGTKRVIAENTAAVTMKIIERISGRLSYYLRHNTKPPVGSSKTDTTTKASLVYNF